MHGQQNIKKCCSSFCIVDAICSEKQLFLILRKVLLIEDNPVDVCEEHCVWQFWMVVPCIWFEIRFSYQLDAIFVYFSSTCFGLIRPSSGAIECIISFTNAAYGVQLGAGLEECVRWWCVALQCNTPPARAHSRPTASWTPYAAFVKEIINSIAPEDGRISPKHVELKQTNIASSW